MKKNIIFLLMTIVSSLLMTANTMISYAAETSSQKVGTAIFMTTQGEEVSDGCYEMSDNILDVMKTSPMDEAYLYHVTDDPLNFSVPLLINGYMWYDLNENGDEIPVYQNNTYQAFDKTEFDCRAARKEAREYLQARAEATDRYGSEHDSGRYQGKIVDQYYGMSFHVGAMSNTSFEISKTIEGDTIELEDIYVFGPFLDDYGPIETTMDDWHGQLHPKFTNVEFEDNVVKRGFQIMKFKATASWGTTYDMEMPVIGFPKPLSRASSEDPVPVPTPTPTPEENTDPKPSDDPGSQPTNQPTDSPDPDSTEKPSDDPNVPPVNDDDTPDVPGEDPTDHNSGNEDISSEKRTKSALKSEIAVIISAVIGLGIIATGIISGWWLLLFNLLFVNKRKKWHGILTLDKNPYIKIETKNDDTNSLVTVLMQKIDDLQLYPEDYIMQVCETGAYTYLPFNTKMVLSYVINGEVVVEDMKADEELFFDFIRSISGSDVVLHIKIYNHVAGIELDYDFMVN